MIDSGFVCDLLDSIVKVLRLLCVVVGLFVPQITTSCDYVRIGDPHLVERDPRFYTGPSIGSRSISGVFDIHVGAA